ncbi:hypothetical protein CH252_19115 [Rhodococcus sp. 06-1477-1B]|nr:hypothetical protein CH252_19115 [Rhodococcus sp. 06-1477-1B]
MAEIGYQATALVGWQAMYDEAETDPDLQWPQSNKIFDQMRRDDPQAMSTMRAVILPLLEAEWVLEATGVRDEVRDQIADDLGLPVKAMPTKAPLRTKGRFSWEDFLRLAVTGKLTFGHSVFEQVYDVDAFGRAHLAKLAWRPPRTISGFEIAADGGLVAVHQYGALTVGKALGNGTFTAAAVGDVRIPVNRLVVFVNEREGPNWTGVSLLRSAYKMWILKDRTLRVMALADERNGLGLPVVTSPPPPENASYEQKVDWLDAEIARGLEMAKNARAGVRSGASLAHGGQLAFVGVTGELPDLEAHIRYYDEQISKAVLAHFLTLGGDKSTGSYALGDTFASFFVKSLNALARQIASVIQQHVIEDLVDANWGSTEPAPRLVPPKIGAEHPATAEAIRALLESRAITWDPTLEAHLRQTYGLPLLSPAQVEERVAAENAARAAEQLAPVDAGATPAPRTRREARALAAVRRPNSVTSYAKEAS